MNALGYLFIRLHSQGMFMNELFWGLWLFPFGLLVFRSGFLPRFIGVWLMINCFGYVAPTSLVPATENEFLQVTKAHRTNSKKGERLASLARTAWLAAWISSEKKLVIKFPVTFRMLMKLSK